MSREEGPLCVCVHVTMQRSSAVLQKRFGSTRMWSTFSCGLCDIVCMVSAVMNYAVVKILNV